MSAQDTIHGVQERGTPAALAAEHHDVQTDAKARAWGELKALQDAEGGITGVV